METFSVISTVLGVGAPMAQAQQQHEQQVELTNQLHRKAIQQAERHHWQSIMFSTLAAARENSRDLWAQKTNLLQTLMITDTLMFGCGFEMAVQGMPPTSTPSGWTITFSVLLASSICVLFVSVWCAMRLQARMGKFNIFNSDQRYFCGLTHSSFHAYYLCHCQQLASWGFGLFYVGTILLMAAASILMVARFGIDYDVPAAGICFAVIVGTAFLTLFVLNFMIDSHTRIEKVDSVDAVMIDLQNKTELAAALPEDDSFFGTDSSEPAALHPDRSTEQLIARTGAIDQTPMK